MGLPCWLKERDEDGDDVYADAPDCTDNFQVRPFFFDGREWQSVEQCYQALKFVDKRTQDEIRSMRKKRTETDAEHGARVWTQGQSYTGERPDWNVVKVEIMYRINCSKYMQHLDLQGQLLGTGAREIEGRASTSWTTKDGIRMNWSLWNGRIQMRIREELRPEADRQPGLLLALMTEFEDYLTAEGGCSSAIPEIQSSVPPRGSSSAKRAAASRSRAASRERATPLSQNSSRVAAPTAKMAKAATAKAALPKAAVSRARGRAANQSPGPSPRGGSTTAKSIKRTDEAQRLAANIFRRFDGNGDGLINRDDMTKVLQALEPGCWHEKKVESLLGEMSDGGSEVEYERFLRWIFRPGDEQKEIMKLRIFTVGDRVKHIEDGRMADVISVDLDGDPIVRYDGDVVCYTVIGRDFEVAIAGNGPPPEFVPTAAESEALEALRKLEEQDFRKIAHIHAREATEITPWLFLGGRPAAKEILQGQRPELKITHVLSCVYDSEERPCSEDLERAGILVYDGFWSHDEDWYDLMGFHWQQCQKFLTEARARDGRIFVHCRLGVNRSALVAAAFLVETGMPAVAAVRLICEKRGLVLCGNTNFQRQLVQFASQKGRL